MIAGLFFDLFGAPSLSEFEQRTRAERGLEDGVAGKRPRSHAQEYTAAFDKGRLFRSAMERDIALTFGPSCRCPQCRHVYPEVVSGTCYCTPLGTRLEPGLEALYGPGNPDDECDYYSFQDLRRLCAQGVPVLTLEGGRLNEQILVQ